MKKILTAAMLLCLMEVTAMADNTASFEIDAIGTTPKGWTAAHAIFTDGLGGPAPSGSRDCVVINVWALASEC